MERRYRILLISLVILGLLGAGWQLLAKATTEPLARSVALAVDLTELRDRSALAQLAESGVYYVLVHQPEDLAWVTPPLQAVPVLSAHNWIAWSTAGIQPDLVMFADNEFAGEAVEDAAWLEEAAFGLIELIPPRSFADYQDLVRNRVIRVFDQPADYALRKYKTAVRERQADLLVVRLFADAAGDERLAHLTSVRQALEEAGQIVAPGISPRPEISTTPVYFLVALSLGAVSGLTLSWLFDRLSRLFCWLPLLALLAAVLLSSLVDEQLSRQLVSFGAALLYPSSGFVWWWSRRQRREPGLWPVLLDWLGMTGFALAGGLMLQAVLGQTVFQLKIAQFLGVKASYLLPMALALVLVLLAWSWHFRQRDGRIWTTNAREHWLIVGGLLILFAAVYVLLLGSGRAPGVQVSPVESSFRDTLEALFWVRPRTKEVLLFPALLCGFYLWRNNWRILGGLAILYGFIAELSLVNTFEHIHHPVVVSLVRSGLSLSLGLIAGLLGILLLRPIVKWVSQR
ncbi:MAG: DUF5693 family protein [Bacillota bacterium]